MANELATASTNTEKSKVALCLSGGGYRAALFHLGGLRRLHELGILQQIDTISSVSGGSIISAFLAKIMVENNIQRGLRFENWETQVAVPFRRFVLNDIRTIPVFAHLLWNWAMPSFRASHLARYYKNRLSNLKLNELPEKPEFIFCATDLTFGVNWEFRRHRVGDYQVGYCRPDDKWTLASAVAASSCFPPIFGPVRLKLKTSDFRYGRYRKPDREVLLSKLSLTDGGVYDNLGLEPVRKHNIIFVSDGGAPFGYVYPGNVLSRTVRYTMTMLNQVQALRKRMLHTEIKRKYLQGAYWSLNYFSSKTDGDHDFIGYNQQLVTDKITKIRTDLDRFNEAEARILENHGYFAANAQILKSAPELISANAPPITTPSMDWVSEAIIYKALKNSHKRITISRLLRLK
ncbi:MAG TPA: patatin-like phospholipase family protein [Pyrinomonadaceae bacterium]|jgi:NTE family protein